MDNCILCVPKASGSFLTNLFATDFVPRAACVGERPEIIWLHVLSDTTIALSYFSIPIALAYFVRRRSDLSFRWLFALFAAFIFACGSTHVLSVFAFWIPMYRLDGVIKAITGGVSATTALMLWPVIPKALALPSPSDLQAANLALAREVGEKEDARARAATLAEELDERVKARTIELERVNQELRLHRDNLDELVRARTRELERSQLALQTSERMASLGTLAAGLGHDMGNILMPVGAWLDELERADLSSTDRVAVSSLRRSLEYLRSLSSGLRLLALHPDGAQAPATATRLSDWWAQCAPLCRAALPRGATLKEPEALEELPAVAIASHALTQAVFNLVQNAGDALRERGSGSIRIAASLASSVPDPNSPLEQPRFVELTISDDGPGMTPEVLARCMEPFFTTKARGRGTGLGLPMVHAAITQRGGEVHVTSSLGAGTTFTLRLPVAHTADDSLAGPSATKIEAVVKVTDARLGALCRALASYAGFEVLESPQDAKSSDRCLWIVDAGVPPQTVDAHVSAGGVVITLAQHAPSANHTSAIIHAQDTGVAAIRDALARASDMMRR